MKNFRIINLPDFSGTEAQIYSVLLDGESKTLLSQFFEENAQYKKELRRIAEKLHVMGHDTGCRRDFFTHNEGSPGDGVAVLKAGRLRLYCLYIDCTVVCFGSGGYKPSHVRAYQEDEKLYSKVQQVKNIAKRINKAIKEKDITIEDNGVLNINYWDNE